MFLIKTIQEATEPLQSSAEQQKKHAAALPYLEELSKHFSFEWVNAFSMANSDAWCSEIDNAYERGFLDDCRLCLELHSKLSSN